MRAAGDDLGAARTIYNQGLVRANFAQQATDRLDDNDHDDNDGDYAYNEQNKWIH